MIPAQAVEAAAKAMFAIQHEEDEWKKLPGFVHDQYRREVSSILEAAAPHMLAPAWDEAATSVRNDMEVAQRIYVMRRIKAANPYRLAP